MSCRVDTGSRVAIPAAYLTLIPTSWYVRRVAAGSRPGAPRLDAPCRGRGWPPRTATREGTVPYCTIVEFAWTETFGRDQFASMASGGDQAPEGRLSRIAGADDSGARMIEVWRSGDDARASAERSAP